jgi:hypothetical protein
MSILFNILRGALYGLNTFLPHFRPLHPLEKEPLLYKGYVYVLENRAIFNLFVSFTLLKITNKPSPNARSGV